MEKENEKVAKVYTTASLTRDEVIEDKLDLFGELLTFLYGYRTKFGDAPYCLDLITFLYDYYIAMITELNREHEIYSAIMQYLADLDDAEINSLKNGPLMDELMEIMIKLDKISDTRIISHVKFYNYYDELLTDGYLTNNNYRFLKYREVLTEEKKQKLLAIIPKK